MEQFSNLQTKPRDAVVFMERLEARRLHMRELLSAGIGGPPSWDTPLSPVATGLGETV
ncbi:hypothetical protein [Paenibacillus ginsengarvi]|uniref:hypothetical protein n=1 Tax=Paenibacillus ginsengarvi TaxID=400777 RepID=UPI00131560B3|nr:hypothetical protein [Paenibacillus ginsengarvi]